MTMQARLVVLLWLVVFQFCAGVSLKLARAELIGNGDFENGMQRPWGTGSIRDAEKPWWTQSGCDAIAEVDRHNAYRGAASLHIVNRSPRAPDVYATTQQEIAITPHQPYRILLWARAENLRSDGSVSIIVDEHWRVRPIQLPQGTYDWTLFSGVFSLPSKSMTLRILTEDQGEVWIDHIELEPEVLPLANADFEQGLQAPWGTGVHNDGRSTWWFNGKCNARAAIDTQVVHGGKQSLHIVNTSPRGPNCYGTTERRVNITPGRHYQISVWAKARHLSSKGAVSIVVDRDWTVRPIELPSGTYDWQPFHGTFKLNEPTADLRILCEDAGELWLDDLRIVIDEPALHANQISALETFEFAEVYRSAGRIEAGRGGEVRGIDGTCFTLAENHSDAPVDVVLRRFELPVERTSPKCQEFMALYDIRVSGAALTKPATVSFPLEHMHSPAASRHRVVCHFNSSTKSWEQLVSHIDIEQQTITVTTKDFSPFLVVEPSPLATTFLESQGSAVTPHVLEIPYYNQGTYEWCWATCTAMLEGANGDHRQVWEIAKHPLFKAGRLDGTNNANRLKEYLLDRHPDWEIQTNGFYFFESLNGYLISQIDAGQPVWVGLPYINHAVLVVGYGPDGIYLHDPSGQLIEYAMGKAESERASSSGNLARYLVPWERWEIVAQGKTLRTIQLNSGKQNEEKITWFRSGRELLNRSNPFAALFSNQTLSVHAKPAAQRSLSLQVMPDDDTFTINHRTVTPDGKMSMLPAVKFFWMGKNVTGHLFAHTCEQQVADTKDLGPLCRDDVLSVIRLLISNTSEKARGVRVRVHLDGKLLGEASGNIAALKVLEPLVIKPFVWNGQTRKELDLSELELGPHILRFELFDEEALADYAEVSLLVAPQMVRNIRCELVDHETVRVIWDGVAEEQASGARISYEVHAIHQGSIPIATSAVNEHSMEIRPNVGGASLEGMRFSVFAHDEQTGLKSQFALKVKPVVKPTPAREPDRVFHGSLVGGDHVAPVGKFQTWFSCPSLTLSMKDQGNRDYYQLTGTCKGESQAPWRDGRVIMTTDLKVVGSSGIVAKKDGRVHARLSGNIKLEYYDATGVSQQMLTLNLPSLMLEGTARGNIAEGTFQLFPGAGVDPPQAGVYWRTDGWNGEWRAELQ